MTGQLAAIDVLVDGSGRLGPLSYLVGDRAIPALGDVVQVPFGQHTRYGLVVGDGDVFAATREILGVVGRRAHPDDLRAAQRLSRRHLCDPIVTWRRFAPPRHKGADSPEHPEPRLRYDDDRVHGGQFTGKESRRRFFLRPLDSDPAAFAARHIDALSATGQVLVLCPTTDLVDRICARFDGGAVRLDAGADRGNWAAFRDGQLRVGVGTRACSWYSPAQLGGIVVVESSHPGHVEAREPHMSARDVALERTIDRGHLVMFDTHFDVAALHDQVTLWEPDHAWLPPITWWDRQPRAIPSGLKTALARWGRNGDTVLVVAGDQCRRHCRRCRHDKPCSHHHPADCSCSQRCPRCGHDDSFVIGWDAHRLTQHCHTIPGGDRRQIVDLGDIGQLADPFDRVVLLNGDVGGTHFTPVQTTLNRLAAVGRLARHELAVVIKDRHHPAVQAARTPQPRRLMRAVWDEARHLRFPPFGHVARIVCGQQQPPDLSRFPGTCLGPRRNRDGDWEYLICFSDEHVDELARAVGRLKKRGQVQLYVDGPAYRL